MSSHEVKRQAIPEQVTASEGTLVDGRSSHSANASNSFDDVMAFGQGYP